MGMACEESLQSLPGEENACVRAVMDVEGFVTRAADLFALFEAHPRIGLAGYKNLCSVVVDRLVVTNMVARTALSQ